MFMDVGVALLSNTLTCLPGCKYVFCVFSHTSRDGNVRTPVVVLPLMRQIFLAC